MKMSVCAASVLALAAGAQAAPFAALSYEAGGGLPGIVGAGLTVSGGGFYVSAGAGDNVLGGGPANFTAGNEQEFDSRWSLSGFGPAARNRSITTGDNSSMTLSFYGDYGAAGVVAQNWSELESTTQNGFGPFHAAGAAFVVGPGSHVGDDLGDGDQPENQARAGIGVSPPPVLSHFAPNATGGRSSFDGVFVGRFTIQAGASLSGGMLFNTVDPSSPTNFFGAHIALDGAGVAFNTTNGVQVLGLRSYRVGSRDIQNPSDATNEGVNVGTPFGLADVYDLWVQVIPTPGALALFGIGGLTLIRRRRA